MNFPELVVFNGGDLWVPGPEHDTRSDGTSSLMVSSAYGARKGIPEGSVMVDELGARWLLRTPVKEGFFFEGIILEEEASVRNSE